MKALALLLYAIGNVDFVSIARIPGVSDGGSELVRDEARSPEPSTRLKWLSSLSTNEALCRKKTEKLSL